MVAGAYVVPRRPNARDAITQLDEFALKDSSTFQGPDKGGREKYLHVIEQSHFAAICPKDVFVRIHGSLIHHQVRVALHLLDWCNLRLKPTASSMCNFVSTMV